MRVSLFLLLGIGAGSAFAQDAVPDNAENHWIYVAVADLKKAGLLVSYSTHRSSDRLSSRYEFAVAAHAAASLLQRDVASAAKEAELLGRTAPGARADELRSSLQGSVRRLKQAVPAARTLQRLIVRFAPELKELGVAPDLSHKVAANIGKVAGFRIPQAGEALGGFADVPANHWAFEATKHLRSEGVLRGYPGGAFKKER